MGRFQNTPSLLKTGKPFWSVLKMGHFGHFENTRSVLNTECFENVTPVSRQ